MRPAGDTRALFPLGLVFLAVGLASAAVVPYLSLFLSTAVGAGPVRVTVFLTASPLAGVVAATLLGRLSDRRAVRRTLLIGTAAAGLISTALTAFVRDYWVLLALAVTATGLAGALFPQSFAYARQLLTSRGSRRAAFGISTLRTVFSLAWVAGPPLASVLLRAGGFPAVYGLAAAMYGLAGLLALGWLREVPRPPVPPAGSAGTTVDGPVPASRWTLWGSAAAFTLLQCPLTLGVQALPLYLRTDLGGDPSEAGLILGLCAALEIPMMLTVGGLSARVRLRPLLLAGAGAGVAYYGLATLAGSVPVLAAGQVVNAAFVAAVSGLGISYMQELLPGHPGRATTLFTNSFPIGAMLAGPLLGLAQHFGYRLAYAVSTVLCAAGLLLLLIVRTPRPDGPVAVSPAPRPTAGPPGAGTPDHPGPPPESRAATRTAYRRRSPPGC